MACMKRPYSGRMILSHFQFLLVLYKLLNQTQGEIIQKHLQPKKLGCPCRSQQCQSRLRSVILPIPIYIKIPGLLCWHMTSKFGSCGGITICPTILLNSSSVSPTYSRKTSNEWGFLPSNSSLILLASSGSIGLART